MFSVMSTIFEDFWVRWEI